MEIEVDIKLKNYATSGSLTAPVIVKNKNSIAFGNGYLASFSPSQNVSVGGFNLTNPIIITAPAGFIINTNNSNVDMGPINLVPTLGTVPSTIIYIKFNPNVAVAYNSNITMASIGATTRLLNVNGTGIIDIAPTYMPATIALASTMPTIGEIGAPYSAPFQAVFTQNDAGAAIFFKIQKDGVDLSPTGGPSGLLLSDSDVFDVTPINYRAFVDYSAGPLKNYSPSGNVDARPALVRNINAPQASEIGFASAFKTFQGELYIFFGESPVPPNTSPLVRSLPKNVSTSEALANGFTFNTGTITNIHAFAIPASLNLDKVIDNTAGTDITSLYILSTFNVNDAGGTAHSYKVYTATSAGPYPVNHIIEIQLL